MIYFNTITSYEDLKKQFRTLATANHPDIGGNVETMKAINNEYDILFPIWKVRNKVETNETAYSTRSEFYTQNGWKGENYNTNLNTKEITKILRDAIKIMYPLCKFSVSFDSFSGGSSIDISLMEAPYNVFVSDEAITKHYIDGTTKISKHIQMNHFYIENESRITEQCKLMFEDINSLIKSYRFDDSDGMIDYFHTNFYYDLNIGRWNKDFEVVEKTTRIGQKANCKDKGLVVSEQQTAANKQQPYTYEIWQDIDTRDGSTIFMVKILEKLDKGEYITASNYMKKLGGYYSKFKRGFLFKADPTEVLNGTQTTSDVEQKSA